MYVCPKREGGAALPMDLADDHIEFDGGDLSILRVGPSDRAVVITLPCGDSHLPWAPLVDTLLGMGVGAVVWRMPEDRDLDLLDRAIGAVIDSVISDAERVVLIGASLGGTLSLRAASTRGIGAHDGVVSISSPRTVDGRDWLPLDCARKITCPKLMIASEFDDAVDDVRDIFAMLEDPRQIVIYPGDAHGTGLMADQSESLTQQLAEFVEWAFGR